MGINQAEERPGNALINEIKELRRDFNEYRDTPQRIGNGSLNWAVFVPFSLGPFTIPAGLRAKVGLTYMDIGSTFTYDGKEAINRTTMIDPSYTVTVDADDLDHADPYGAALTVAQRNVDHWVSKDYYQSNFSESNGQRTIYINVRNVDSSTHNYWIHGTAVIPRPALKPQ